MGQVGEKTAVSSDVALTLFVAILYLETVVHVAIETFSLSLRTVEG